MLIFVAVFPSLQSKQALLQSHPNENVLRDSAEVVREICVASSFALIAAVLTCFLFRPFSPCLPTALSPSWARLR
jgi:hypothetical protein